MKRSLCIGILELTPAWISLLDQLGVWYQKVSPETENFNDFSLIIANKTPTNAHISKLKNYLRQGGNVIFINDDLGFFPDKRFERKYLKRVPNDLKLDGFEHIPYLDLYTEVKTKGGLKISDLVVFKKVMSGQVAYIGFNPAELLFQTRYSRKQFVSSFTKNPDEIVNKVSKGLVSDFFLQIIKGIHFKSNLPFIRKWTSPEIKPVFCFRIDSDYSDEKHIKNVYSLLKRHEIHGTWFLHVKAHEEWLSHFNDLEGQEIALHGYRHGTSRSKNKVINNISKGLKKLTNLGFNINGYCAPYGIYNRALEKALGEFEFKYTSEFTFAYDAYPIKYKREELQIPIHPICTGSLMRRGFSEEEMLSYFNEILERKLARFESVIFYHHPLQSGLNIFDSLFDRINETGLVNLSFEQYADFWSHREKCTFKAYSLDDKVHLANVSDDTQLFEVSFNHRSSQLITSAHTIIDVETGQNIQYNLGHSVEDSNDSLGITDKLRLIKTSILDYRNRERL